MNKIQSEGQNKWLHITLIIAAIWIAYYKILHAPFCVWDDDVYVFNNTAIRTFSIEHIRLWFSSYYVGNYAPLTMFTYAIDFLIGKNGPFIYHFTNVFIHCCNAIILYFLIVKIQKNSIVALFTSLLFALHPMQIECVTWIAERKTVLCTFFYLLALLQYASYVAKPLYRKLLLVFLLGIAAMLSKAIAVSLPLSMFALDIWMQRAFKSKKLWLEKIPLIGIAVIIGLLAIKAEDAGKFLGLHPKCNWKESTVLAAVTYVDYAIHLFAPVRLSLFYPYPEKIGFLQYACLLIAIGVAGLLVIAWRKKWNILCGGILFYTVNIALVLQFIGFSAFLMVDHYSYIAGIGIFFPLVYYVVTWFQERRKILVAIFFCSWISILLLIASFIHNDIWLSDVNFFNSIVDSYPNSSVAQYTMGAVYMNKGNYKEAETHFNQAVIVDGHNYKAWYDKGSLYLHMGRVNESLDAFNKCLSIRPYTLAYFNRALLYMGTGRPALALADAEKTLDAEPENARAWYIKAVCTEQLGNVMQAIAYYSKAIAYEGTEPLFYLKRGTAYTNTDQYQLALEDLDKAIALEPANGTAYYYRGIVKYKTEQDPCNDFQAAIAKGYKVPEDVTKKICNSSIAK